MGVAARRQGLSCIRRRPSRNDNHRRRPWGVTAASWAKMIQLPVLRWPWALPDPATSCARHHPSQQRHIRLCCWPRCAVG